MSQVNIILGAQWGDEGKGKWVDIFSENHDIVARFQGGNNAGHTLYINEQKVVLHQIPSGIFREKLCVLAAGVVINPMALQEEIQKIDPLVHVTPAQLWLSARAHVITPWHIAVDEQREARRNKPIGTTKRGIGPTYASKAARNGLRLGDYIVQNHRNAWIDEMRHDPAFDEHYVHHQELWDQFIEAAKFIAPFICDADARLRQLIYQKKKKILLEGAQGALLDIDHGTYPFVTSSSTAAGGACTSIGFAPRKVSNIWGVAKAYLTRVGEGPFPTELINDPTGRYLAEKGQEFGATTGRPRRCGWLDAVALRYSCELNGLDGIILNKLDVLSGLDNIKLCTHYEHKEHGLITEMPWDLDILNECEPIYETFPGWDNDLSQLTKFEELPIEAKTFISAIEEACHTPILWVGNGPQRQHQLAKP